MLVTLYDTETTGLIKTGARRLTKQPHVIEFYAMTIEQTGDGEDAQFRFVEEIDELINPGSKVPVTPEITRITGIHPQMVASKAGFPTFAPKIKALFDRSDRVVAHNLSFDMEIIEIEFKRINETIEWPQRVCTVEATEWIKGFRLKLTDLHEELFGQKFEGAHRAKVDVFATCACYTELVRRKMV